MSLRRRNRKRARHLSDESPAARRRAAQTLIPELEWEKRELEARKVEAQNRFGHIVESRGASQNGTPAVDPGITVEADTFRFLAWLLLASEAAAAFFAAQMAIGGGLLAHTAVAVLSTVILTSLGKVIAVAQLRSSRPRETRRNFRRQILICGLVCAGFVATFFLGRFTPAAEFLFLVCSTALSLGAAYLVALAWTLASFLRLPNQMADQYLRLSRDLGEVDHLLEQARSVIARVDGEDGGDDPGSPPETATVARRAIRAAMVLTVLTMGVVSSDVEARTLHVWVDVSGSLAPEEYERVARIVSDIKGAVERHEIRGLAVQPFWQERNAYSGPPHTWTIPPQPDELLEPACEQTASLFRHTEEEQMRRCEAAMENSVAAWRTEIATPIEVFRAALLSINVSEERSQTCLWPVIRRSLAGQAKEVHLILTDGGHFSCGEVGETPPSRQSMPKVVVILIPDTGGMGVAQRLDDRWHSIKETFPGVSVIPSWRVEASRKWWDWLILPGRP